jgi:hypothetical protein
MSKSVMSIEEITKVKLGPTFDLIRNHIISVRLGDPEIISGEDEIEIFFFGPRPAKMELYVAGPRKRESLSAIR